MDEVSHSGEGSRIEPDKFTRMVNSLSRVSRLTLNVEDQRNAAALLKATLAKA
jgi:hypothetical protein